jgi:hypothetical protein
LLVAMHVNAREGGTRIYRSRLQLEAPTNRPDPNILREEILPRHRKL